MSKQSVAWSRTGMGRTTDKELRKQLKAAFAAGWDARDAEASKAMAAKDAEVERLRDAISTAHELLSRDNGCGDEDADKAQAVLLLEIERMPLPEPPQ